MDELVYPSSSNINGDFGTSWMRDDGFYLVTVSHSGIITSKTITLDKE